MAANTRTKAVGFAYNDNVTATEFNKLDTNGAQSVNRNSSVGGWGVIPAAFIGEYVTGGYGVIYASGGNLVMTTKIGTISGSASYSLNLRPLKGHLLTGVRVWIKGAAGHGGAPAVLPTISLTKTAHDSVVPVAMGSDVYVWGGGGAEPATYEAGSYLEITGLAETINTAEYDYRLEITVESGANYVDDGEIGCIQANVTIDPSYAGPDFSMFP